MNEIDNAVKDLQEKVGESKGTMFLIVSDEESITTAVVGNKPKLAVNLMMALKVNNGDNTIAEITGMVFPQGKSMPLYAKVMIILLLANMVLLTWILNS